MRKQLYTFCLAALMSFPVSGQDLHFSQFYASPHTLNPALTGVFNGCLRVGANFRNQWGNFVPFQTYGAYVDGALFQGKLNGDFVGLGANFYSDQAGIGKIFQTTRVDFSGSFNKLLSEAPFQYLSFGVQGSMHQKSITPGQQDWGTLYEEGVNYDPGVPGSASANAFDLSAGLLWYSTFSESVDLYAGLALFHVTGPQLTLIRGSVADDKLFMKTTMHVGGRFAVSEKMSIVPSILVLKQGPDFETNIGTFLRFDITPNDDRDIAVYVGPWLRLVGEDAKPFSSDAFILAARFDIMEFGLGISYDINVSGLQTLSNSNGGPELSLIYTGDFCGDRGRRGGRINCPRI